MNNPLIQLHSHFVIHSSHLMTFSVYNVSLSNTDAQAFDSSNINVIFTNNYHICCIATIRTVCTAFKPWYISCSNILPTLNMKIFYKIVSVAILFLNFLSVIIQIKSFQSNKCFSLIVISINGNDILCAIYLGCVWIADLSFGDSFKVKRRIMDVWNPLYDSIYNCILLHNTDRKFTYFIIFIKTYGSNLSCEL